MTAMLYTYEYGYDDTIKCIFSVVKICSLGSSTIHLSFLQVWNMGVCLLVFYHIKSDTIQNKCLLFSFLFMILKVTRSVYLNAFYYFLIKFSVGS